VQLTVVWGLSTGNVFCIDKAESVFVRLTHSCYRVPFFHFIVYPSLYKKIQYVCVLRVRHEKEYATVLVMSFHRTIFVPRFVVYYFVCVRLFSCVISACML